MDSPSENRKKKKPSEPLGADARMGWQMVMEADAATRKDRASSGSWKMASDERGSRRGRAATRGKGKRGKSKRKTTARR